MSWPVAADTAAIACELLCVSTPITIISLVLSLDATYGRTSGGHTSLGAKPRSYQVTPEILGRWRATQRVQVRPKADSQYLSQPVTSPRPHRYGRTSTARDPDDDSEASIPQAIGTWGGRAPVAPPLAQGAPSPSPALRHRMYAPRASQRLPASCVRVRHRARGNRGDDSDHAAQERQCASSPPARCYQPEVGHPEQNGSR